MRKNRGISLIVLVIIIIVIVILSGAVILSLSQNNPIKSSEESVFKTKIGEYSSELSIYLSKLYVDNNGQFDPKKFWANSIGSSLGGSISISDVIKGIKVDDKSKFEVIDGGLIYIGQNDNEINWMNEIIYNQGIPTNYTKLEYIQNSGNGEYLDLKYVPNNNTKIETQVTVISNNVYSILYGARIALQNSMFRCFVGYVSNELRYYADYNNTQVFASSCIANVKTTLLQDRNKFYVDNILKYTWAPAIFNSSCNLYLFAYNDGGITNTNEGILKMHSIKVFDNDVLIRDMVPVKRNSDNVIGMYDLVGRKFYTNSGTGAFIAG